MRRIPFALVLAESFLEQHPEGSVTALVSDAVPGDLDGESRLRCLTPRDVGWSDADLSHMAMAWSEKLLNRALIPDLLSLLIQRSFQPALFFADDTSIYARLDDLEALADNAGLVLSPRTAAPLPSDGCTPDHSDLLQSGVLGAGFAAVGPSAKDCLELWKDLIRAEFTVTESEVVPERILDLLAAVFPSQTPGDPGAGVTFWNVWDTLITKGPAGLEIAGHPLKFFHFDGFTPDEAHLLSTGQGPRPRILLSERADLRLLTGAYCRRLLAAGFVEASRRPYGFEVLPSGVKVDERMRRLHREHVKAALKGEAPFPPDPFHPPESDEFFNWLNSPDEDGPAPSVSRYLYALYEGRGDLRAAFPGIARIDAERFLDWVVEFGAREAAIPQELWPVNRPAPTADSQPEIEQSEQGTVAAGEPAGRAPAFGVNVVGHFKAELGVGEIGRLVLAGIEQAEIPFSTTAYSAFHSRQTHSFTQVGREFAYNVNLFCVNADQLPLVIRDYGPSILERRYNIGVWWWEVNVFPPEMAASADHLDEIWVGSEYVGRTISERTQKLVLHLPIPIRRIRAAPLNRETFGIPEGFLFLASFDFLSVFERKNPMAVVEAYKRAFRPGEGTALLIKTINGRDHLHQLEKLRVAVVDRPDIKIMDCVLSEEDKDRLLASCDCYVSLHRAEGYGLGMAEAMALGKPIIATGYSGNLAFLDETNSFLVDYELVPVPTEAGPYPEGAAWAEPDVGQAADFMRSIFDDPEKARSIGRKALQDALEIHNQERTAEFIAGRLHFAAAVRRGSTLPGEPASDPGRPDGPLAVEALRALHSRWSRRKRS